MLQTVKVYPDTKNRIDKYKKRGDSYDDVLTAFVDYFDATNIKPDQIDSSPSTITKKATERVVKILKNIENKKLNKIMLMLDNINDKVSNEVSPESIKNNSFSDDEVQVLVNQIEALKKDKSELLDEITKLNKQVFDAPKNEVEQEDFGFLKTILSCVDQMKKSTKTSMGTSEFRIEKNIFNRNTDTIVNLIRNR